MAQRFLSLPPDLEIGWSPFCLKAHEEEDLMGFSNRIKRIESGYLPLKGRYVALPSL